MNQRIRIKLEKKGLFNPIVIKDRSAFLAKRREIQNRYRASFKAEAHALGLSIDRLIDKRLTH